MSRNGSGTYVLPVGNPVVTGTTITSNWANTTFSDVATALTGSVAADGQTPMTGPLAMGNNKITGVANGTASTDVATINQISNPNITGGSIDGAPIGNISPSTGKFTTLSANAGATFTGTCTAPTVTPGSDNSTKIATTAFVQSAISAVSSGVTSFNARTGVVTLSAGDVTGALGYTPYNAGGNTVINTGNIYSYAPKYDGTYASGTWGINITGNAATVTYGAYVNAANTFTSTNTFNSTYAVQIPALKNLVFGTTSEWTIGWDNSTNLLYNFNATAKVYFTTSGAAYNTTGSWGTISDQRIKQNVTPASKYLDKLCQLNVVNYNLIDDEKKMIGFIAQDVEKVMPGLVETSNNTHYNISDFKSLKTSVMIPMLVQAIQELKAEIELLKGAK